ncbi:hypothetical protein BD324DRAFT_622845 [Kockovaella imperatae]|uniref:Uncharacterized protein n=1 Tax=Kockovaella imperatae TaxID=4999 RepID=A0A1Y1UI10_9TREE|nr:hypothetical protein BD324DRAFT_622845 [Kockovaella imperatae]ORX37678.1 hypothetical protein BD324DRAFT_622845 [Kockovaella imperatae]
MGREADPEEAVEVANLKVNLNWRALRLASQKSLRHFGALSSKRHIGLIGKAETDEVDRETAAKTKNEAVVDNGGVEGHNAETEDAARIKRENGTGDAEDEDEEGEDGLVLKESEVNEAEAADNEPERGDGEINEGEQEVVTRAGSEKPETTGDGEEQLEEPQEGDGMEVDESEAGVNGDELAAAEHEGPNDDDDDAAVDTLTGEMDAPENRGDDEVLPEGEIPVETDQDREGGTTLDDIAEAPSTPPLEENVDAHTDTGETGDQEVEEQEDVEMRVERVPEPTSRYIVDRERGESPLIEGE